MMHPLHRSKHSTTSLADRIAKLNLQGEGGSNGSSGSGPTSSSSLSTGAKGKISDKINKYQANAEAEPLIPLGSFGFGGVRRVPSGQQANQLDRPRVASLGSGRAPVPLGVVKARSVSGVPGSGSSGPPSDASDLSRPASPLVQPPSPLVGADGQPQQPAAAAGSAAPINIASRALERSGSQASALSVGAMTPGSVSSMQVEAGSDTSGHGHLNDLDSDAGGRQGSSRAGDSPLSSPIIDAVNIDLTEPSVPPSPTGGLSTSPSQPLRGPLDSLRAPLRNGSNTSLSSMAVEAGSTIAAEDADASTPSAETPAELPTTVGGPVEEDEHTPQVSDSEREKNDAERERATKLELEQYEQEKSDPVAAPSPVPEIAPDGSVSVNESTESADTPKMNEPVPATVEPPSAPVAADEAELAPEEVAAAPEVKCSDCQRSISLLELAEHKCEAGDQPPALMGSPVISPTLDSAPKMTRSRSALSELADMAAAPRDPNIKVAPPLSRSSSTKLGYTASPSQSLDQFVSQTSDVVPADVDDDMEDDHFPTGEPTSGAYPDSPTVPRSVSHDSGMPTSPYSSNNDIPQDLSDNENDAFGAEHDASTFKAARSVLLEAGKRRASTAAGASQASPTVSRSTSMHSSASMTSNGSYAKKNFPGYYNSDDEEGYEGGSVTIVRTTATHRA